MPAILCSLCPWCTQGFQLQCYNHLPFHKGKSRKMRCTGLHVYTDDCIMDLTVTTHVSEGLDLHKYKLEMLETK